MKSLFNRIGRSCYAGSDYALAQEGTAVAIVLPVVATAAFLRSPELALGGFVVGAFVGGIIGRRAHAHYNNPQPQGMA